MSTASNPLPSSPTENDPRAISVPQVTSVQPQMSQNHNHEIFVRLASKLKHILPVITLLFVASAVVGTYMQPKEVRVLGASASAQNISFFKRILIFLGLAQPPEQVEARPFEYVVPDKLKSGQVIDKQTLPVASIIPNPSVIPSFRPSTYTYPTPIYTTPAINPGSGSGSGSQPKLAPPPIPPILGEKSEVSVAPPVPASFDKPESSVASTIRDFFGKIVNSLKAN